MQTHIHTRWCGTYAQLPSFVPRRRAVVRYDDPLEATFSLRRIGFCDDLLRRLLHGVAVLDRVVSDGRTRFRRS